MKAITRRRKWLALRGIFLAITVSLGAAEAPAKNEKPETGTKKAESPIQEYVGTLQSVDTGERTAKVDKFLWSKTFNLAEDCSYTTGLDKKVDVEELKPGMEVVVNYEEMDGVTVATHIAQRRHTHTGYVKAVTPAKREVIMDRIGLTRTFRVNDETVLSLHNKEAELSQLKGGQKVTIIYTKEGEMWLAQKIEDTSETFSGTVEAMDEGANTLKAKSMLGTRKFNLGEGCKIIINGNDRARLRDLRIGQQVSIHYEEMKGVMVAARIEHIGNENDTPIRPVAQGEE